MTEPVIISTRGALKLRQQGLIPDFPHVYENPKVGEIVHRMIEIKQELRELTAELERMVEEEATE